MKHLVLKLFIAIIAVVVVGLFSGAEFSSFAADQDKARRTLVFCGDHFSAASQRVLFLQRELEQVDAYYDVVDGRSITNVAKENVVFAYVGGLLDDLSADECLGMHPNLLKSLEYFLKNTPRFVPLPLHFPSSRGDTLWPVASSAEKYNIDGIEYFIGICFIDASERCVTDNINAFFGLQLDYCEFSDIC